MNEETPMREDLPDPAKFLEEAGIAFAREGNPDDLVQSFYLRASRGRAVLLMMPHGLRADFRALARHLGMPRFSLGRRSETLHFGQFPSSLSPFALRYDGEKRVQPALDERLLQYETLGFPGKPGTAPIWLEHKALILLLRGLGYRTVVGDWAAQ
jgi:hypothetical protein